MWITKRFILLQSLHMNPVITALSVLPISAAPGLCPAACAHPRTSTRTALASVVRYRLTERLHARSLVLRENERLSEKEMYRAFHSSIFPRVCLSQTPSQTHRARSERCPRFRTVHASLAAQQHKGIVVIFYYYYYYYCCRYYYCPPGDAIQYS